jgi:hypothetical protein
METKKSVQISFIILLCMTILAFVYGLLAVIKPDLFVTRSFQLYTEQSWNDYLGANPTLANYMLILERMAAGNGFAVSIAGLFVLLTVFKKVEKWAWFFVATVSIIGWVNVLVANIAFNNPITITIITTGLALLVIGLIIPAKDFLGKNLS